MSETEQNKSEEATPFKLKKARDKGQVARGTDLGFLAVMSALTLFTIALGPSVGARLSEMMRTILAGSIASIGNPGELPSLVSRVYQPAIQAVALLGGTIVLVVIALEILQLRGLVFSAHPLKPDFSRINPGKGLKRLFSMKMLKDALKNIVKMAIYTTAAVLVILNSINLFDQTLTDGGRVVDAMFASAVRLMIVFTAIALVFAAIDQIITRQEFRKQMRMSRSELKREFKDREGEPRQKQKRKELHAEFLKQTKGLGNLPGSDVLLVNPQHLAVALSYKPGEMLAPTVTAKGRNRFAAMLKAEARRLNIPIIQDKPLARAIFKRTAPGSTIRSEHYQGVARVYLELRRAQARREDQSQHA